jgi:hypothetical protein
MDWFRSWHGAPTDPKWLLIAKRSETQAGIPRLSGHYSILPAKTPKIDRYHFAVWSQCGHRLCHPG